jgi:hypothetical protein
MRGAVAPRRLILDHIGATLLLLAPIPCAGATKLDVVFRAGEAATDGAVLSSIGDVSARRRSDIAFRADSSAIVALTADGPRVVVRTGDPAPSPLGGRFQDFTSPAINRDGLIVFSGTAIASPTLARADGALVVSATLADGGLALLVPARSR